MIRTIKTITLTAYLSIASCFNPHLESGKFKCEREPLCPEGMVCHTDKRCYYPEDIPSDGGIVTTPPDSSLEDMLQQSDMPEPLLPFTLDENCLALFHFDSPEELADSCGKASLEDYGSQSVPSLESFREARLLDGGYLLARHSMQGITNTLTAEVMIQPIHEIRSFEGAFGNVLWQVEAGPSGEYLGFGVQLLPGNRVGATIGINAGQFYEIEGKAVLPKDAFSTVKMTYDGSRLQLYVNGVLDAEREITGTIALPITTPLYLGNDAGSYNRLRAVIDEVRISNLER